MITQKLVSTMLGCAFVFSGAHAHANRIRRGQQTRLTREEISRREAAISQRPPEAPTSDLASTAQSSPGTDCDSLLTAPSRQVQAFLDASTNYHKAMLQEHDVFPSELKKVESVAQIGDALLVRQGGQLKLTRMGSLSPKDALTLALEGSQLVQGWKTGDFYFLRIRRSTQEIAKGDADEKRFTEIMYAIPHSLDKYRTILVTPTTEVDRNLMPNDAGEYIMLGRKYLWIVSRIPAGESRESQIRGFNSERFAFAEVSFPGLIKRIQDRQDLNLPILQVDHLADKDERSELRSSFIDYDLRLIRGEVRNVGASAYELFNLPASAKLSWLTKIGDRPQDFAVTAAWEESGTLRHLVATVKTQPPKEENLRSVQPFDLNEKYFKDVSAMKFEPLVKSSGLNISLIEDSQKPNTRGKSTLLLSNGSNKLSSEVPGLRELPKVLENATVQKLTPPKSDSDIYILRDDPADLIDSSQQIKSLANATEKPLRYTVIRSPKQNQVPVEGLTFTSNVVWTDFGLTDLSIGETGLEKFPRETLFSLIDSGIGKTPVQAILQTKKKASITLIPGYQSSKSVKVLGEDIVLIYGELNESLPAQKFFAVYHPNSDQFLTDMIPLEKSPIKHIKIENVQSNFGRKTDSSGALVIAESPFAGALNDLTIRTEPGKKILWIEGKSIHDEQKVVSLRIDVKNESLLSFQDVKPLELNIPNDESKYGKGSLPRTMSFFTEHKIERSGGKLRESTTFTAVQPNGETSSATAQGDITQAELRSVGSSWKIVGKGQLRLVSRSLPTEIHWAPLSEEKQLVQQTNMRPAPLYADDDVEFLVSDAYLSEPPKLFYLTKEIKEPKEVVLAFDIGKEKVESRSGFDDFLAFLFGLTRAETKTPRNENEIAEITRDQDLFFISTKANAHSPSKTYVWSIRTQSLLFTITNLQTYRDVGDLRFYVGQATNLNDTTVAIFDRNSHQFITYFDFRKLKLATGAKDFVQLNPHTKQIAFKTEGGLTRVFDETQNTFVGLLPQKILDKLKTFENEMGSVLNQQVFMQASEALYERDDFVQNLAKGLVPNSADRLLQDSLIISSPGAGIDHVTQEFMNRWISGEIPESATARLIFLRLDPSRLTSGTMYRGQFADKIANFRNTAIELKNLGYQIVVVIEGLQNIDQTPHNFGEGDLFSSIQSLSHDQVISVLASVTPSGFEMLSRQKQEFMSIFRSQTRLDPLASSATKRAIFKYLKAHDAEGRLTERQVDTIIAQVRRLQPQRQLPGSAFRAVKSLESDGSGVVSDAAIQAAPAHISGIPAMLLDQANFSKHYQTMLDALNRRVVGQSSVIKSLVDSVFAFAQGSNRSDLPIARLLLPGMTGTGKTELARAVSQFLLADSEALLKIDGQNYSRNQDPLGLSKIIAQHVRKYPFCVILIDEFEKMDVEARNVILSIADGSMTDEMGNPVSTALTMLLATTNAGDENAKAYIEANKDSIPEDELIDGIGQIFEKAVYARFSPPILGRFDVIYPYRPLTKIELRGLIRDYLSAEQSLATESVRSRYARRGIGLEFDASTIEYIATHFVNMQLGARRLTSQIEQRLVREFLTPEELTGQLRINGNYIVWANDSGFQLRKK